MMNMTEARRGSLRRGSIVAGLALALLAGCHKAEPVREDDGFANEAVETPPAPVEPPPVAAPAPPPKLPEPDANVADALPAEAPPSPDAQMLEDADASGLTSRVAPSDAASEPPNEATAPAGDGGGGR